MKKIIHDNLIQHKTIKEHMYHLPLDSDSKSITIDHASGGCGCDLTSLTFCLFMDKMGLITHANMIHNKWKTSSKMLGTW